MTQQTGDGLAKSGSISFSRVVDLSWPVHPGIPLWPGDPVVEFETVSEINTVYYTHLTLPTKRIV